jgi:hypothetical protein
MFRKYKIFFWVIIFGALFGQSTIASNIEGTSTYKDYLFVLVHGINGGSQHFNGQDHRDKGLRLLQQLETDLNLQGHVYAYSFNDNKGSSLYNVRELGDRNYQNRASYTDPNGKWTSMDGKCWLDKAREDFKLWYADKILGKKGRPDLVPNSVVPSKYILITHSMGNMAARVNEKATVIIKLNNITNNSMTAYLAQATPNGSTELAAGSELTTPNYLANYIWQYDNTFAKGPEDGIYRVEITARDEAGNESLPRTLESVRIDRTPPAIYSQTTQPYVLSNIGANAYKTTLSYRLSDSHSVKIKVYNANTGHLVDTIENAPNSATDQNRIVWDASSINLPKGAYRFQIIAEDDVGNVGTAYASCVKDGIAPVISYPVEDNAEVSGTISIRGTAIDPDWTNDKPFKNYKVFYKKTGEDWKTDFVEVPLVNRDPKDPKNISIRPLQNNSTLAYLYTNNLENGDYEIKVEVEEDGGEKLVQRYKFYVSRINCSKPGLF